MCELDRFGNWLAELRHEKVPLTRSQQALDVKSGAIHQDSPTTVSGGVASGWFYLDSSRHGPPHYISVHSALCSSAWATCTHGRARQAVQGVKCAQASRVGTYARAPRGTASLAAPTSPQLAATLWMCIHRQPEVQPAPPLLSFATKPAMRLCLVKM